MDPPHIRKLMGNKLLIFPKTFSFPSNDFSVFIQPVKVPHVLDFFGSAGWISPVERCPAGECRFLKPRETLQRWLQLIAAKLCLNLPAQLHFLTLCSGGAHLPPHQIFQVMWRTITVILCFFKLGGGGWSQFLF